MPNLSVKKHIAGGYGQWWQEVLEDRDRAVALLARVGCVCIGGHTRRSPHTGVCAEIRSVIAAAHLTDGKVVK